MTTKGGNINIVTPNNGNSFMVAPRRGITEPAPNNSNIYMINVTVNLRG